MKSIEHLQLREATAADVPAMSRCHLDDPVNPFADSRMAAYFDCQHHPQQSLPARVGYVALVNEMIVGYIAGHRSTRHGCAGEVQYLFVTPLYRRRGIATALLRLLAEWFQSQAAQQVCVGVAADSPKEAKPFYESVGASPLKKHWYAWEDIGASCSDMRPS
ncbi:MAG TPA: GNAT family N-acetyltransferase [Pyrinomonadaceae bacterium]|nr:GNAT family N-acetyltransferase [Pyrinomonadaceae bacterium]